ncbi:hypothetical protein POVCU1_058680 [Plasmodium ovale curtisi]|uniref:Uncharacterized protein n=1 Tax=Plasmodium ovale curtisi TaxID=864141 RepID=A0A1A8X8U8_PLAOA|nr:hypothetical protein POVCU1_058680 [Plasmodium ovale curtisi]
MRKCNLLGIKHEAIKSIEYRVEKRNGGSKERSEGKGKGSGHTGRRHFLCPQLLELTKQPFLIYPIPR